MKLDVNLGQMLPPMDTNVRGIGLNASEENLELKKEELIVDLFKHMLCK